MAVKQVFNTSAELDFPNVLPTLDLDFANSKTLDPRITFTRASGGSYVGADGLIKYAGVNEARFDHDPVTGESLGLLIEESRTNLVNNSLNGYNNIFPSTATITTGIDAPDGTNTAIRFSCNNTGSSLLRVNTATLSNGVVYSASFYVRYISGNTISGSSPALTADICDGASINYLPLLIKDKWVKITFSGIRALTNFPQFNFLDLLSNSTNNYILDFWGAQIEEGSFPTSYIPTQGSTRTRATDNARIIGKNFSEWYRQDEGTVFVRYNIEGRFGVDGFNRVFEFSDGTSNTNFSLLSNSTTDDMFERWPINGANQLNFNTVNTTFNRFYNWVAGYKENDFQRYSIDVNGILDINTDTSISTSNFNQLGIGQDLFPIRKLNGHISRLTYFPKRLPNSQLISLTT